MRGCEEWSCAIGLPLCVAVQCDKAAETGGKYGFGAWFCGLVKGRFLLHLRLVCEDRPGGLTQGCLRSMTVCCNLRSNASVVSGAVFLGQSMGISRCGSNCVMWVGAAEVHRWHGAGAGRRRAGAKQHASLATAGEGQSATPPGATAKGIAVRPTSLERSTS